MGMHRQRDVLEESGHLEREGCLTDHRARLRADDVNAQDLLRLLIGDDLHETVRLVHCHRLTEGGKRELADGDLNPLLLRLGLGDAVFAVGVSMMLLGRLPAVRPKLTLQVIGGGAVVVGAAITGAESAAFATTFGLLVAVVLIGLGTLPGNVLLSLFGCVGLLVNVPWAIGHFFPGQGRAPLLIAVSGVLIVAVAVWLSRQSRELHHQFARH
jgi:hypothetical protein